jgi:hypothetical protein
VSRELGEFANLKGEMFLCPPAYREGGLLQPGCGWITTSYLFLYPRRDLHNQWVQTWEGRLEASILFGPVLESSRLPPTIQWALHGNGVDDARVGS